jgi:hypothetical protein
MLYISVSQCFLLTGPFRLRTITTDPHILRHKNIVCPDDRYPKFKIHIPELIFRELRTVPAAVEKYIPAAYVTMHYII